MAKATQKLFKNSRFNKTQLIALGTLASAAGIYLVFFASAQVPLGDRSPLLSVDLKVKGRDGQYHKSTSIYYGDSTRLKWETYFRGVKIEDQEFEIGNPRSANIVCTGESYPHYVSSNNPYAAGSISSWWRYGNRAPSGEEAGVEQVLGDYVYQVTCRDMITGAYNYGRVGVFIYNRPEGNPAPCPPAANDVCSPLYR